MNLLDLVDSEATERAVAAHEEQQRVTLDPRVEIAASDAARRAWHAALAEGKGREDATAAARAAFEARALEVMASTGVTAPPRAVVPVSRATVVPSPPMVASTQPHNTAPTTVEPGGLDRIGAERAMRDMADAAAAGFAVVEPLYDVGSRVNAVGVVNARGERAAYEAKPLVGDAMARLADRIRGEHRRDTLVQTTDIGMTEHGEVHVGGVRYTLTRNAFGDLCNRLGFGGGGYLASCPPALRAYNLNAQRELAAAREGGTASAIKLRVRDRANGPEVFAAVGASYGSFDADKVAEAVALAAPSDARSAVQYDPATARTRIDVLFHSDVQPEHYVAGEVWKAGIQVRTDDTGGRSLRVDALVFQALCLNFVLTNKMAQPIARIRHIGSVRELARRFRVALAQAHDKLGAFIRAWGYGCREDVMTRSGAVHADMPRNPVDALPGIFNGILSRDLVKIPAHATAPSRRSLLPGRPTPPAPA